MSEVTYPAGESSRFAADESSIARLVGAVAGSSWRNWPSFRRQSFSSNDDASRWRLACSCLDVTYSSHASSQSTQVLLIIDHCHLPHRHPRLHLDQSGNCGATCAIPASACETAAASCQDTSRPHFKDSNDQQQEFSAGALKRVLTASDSLTLISSSLDKAECSTWIRALEPHRLSLHLRQSGYGSQLPEPATTSPHTKRLERPDLSSRIIRTRSRLYVASHLALR